MFLIFFNFMRRDVLGNGFNREKNVLDKQVIELYSIIKTFLKQLNIVRVKGNSRYVITMDEDSKS